ncbi:MAG: cytochrome c [Desulfobacterales bacterium]
MRKTILNQTTATIIFSVLTVVIILSVFRNIQSRSIEAAGDSQEGRGEVVFAQNCSNCHYSDSRKTKIGPGFSGLFDREKLPVSRKPVSEDNVRRQFFDPYKNMPPMSKDLSEQQIVDVIAYLKTL